VFANMHAVHRFNSELALLSPVDLQERNERIEALSRRLAP
jgi:hypothetical protein